MPDIDEYLNGGKAEPRSQAPQNKQWKQITVEVELPFSKNIVVMRPLGFDLVFRQARIPDFLKPLIVKAFKGEDTSDSFKIDEYAQSLEFFDMLDSLCELAFVSPRVVKENPGENEITGDQIGFDDKAWVMQTMGKPPHWLEMFRPGQNPYLEPLVVEQDVSDTAEQTPQVEDTPEA